ncbi:MAG: DUF3048 C-terminal domain-containing protein, partial [Anaerolineaceae bacterium]|nr:DUF3048 C-terminal domain-containing protein [Anaerolineaceae bacterium]
MRSKKRLIILVSLLVFSLACGTVGASPSPDENFGTTTSTAAVQNEILPSVTPVEDDPPAPTQTAPLPVPAKPAAAPQEQPASPQGPVGPDVFPDGVNPLTGLPVSNPGNLALPPALVSITNWPPAARTQQAGLSFSPFVYELYIGEGMSRFLAMFYGDFPAAADPAAAGNSFVGPIRSGRLPYESLRNLYNGFLVMASAYSGVAANLSQYSNIYGSDEGDINSAMISVEKMEQIAQANQRRLGENSLQGNMYDPAPLAGGQAAKRLWFVYNQIDQVVWQYDPASGAYRRYQDNADGTTFIQATDSINAEGLAFENVILLFAQHRACTEAAFDVDLQYTPRSPALLFRDGQVHEIFWTTKSEEYERTTGKMRPIRFIDENGEPIALKPGQTWVHLVPTGTPYWEAPDRQEVPANAPQWVAEDPSGMLY